MKLYLVVLGAGILVGSIYALLNVRSPAPPLVALVGLLGMLLGEQTLPVARRALGAAPLSLRWFAEECAPRVTGVPAKTTSTPADSASIP